MLIFAYSRNGYEESFYKGATLEQVVHDIQDEDRDPEDFTFYVVDPDKSFEVEMKPVRKLAPVRKTK